MAVNTDVEKAFLNRITKITEANLKNDQFGVSKLAMELGMSRSYVHRRLKALTNQSVSQFICTVRLKRAMEMLLQKEASAAEISYEVGFSSPTYFSRCFHEYYGFPPGEVKKMNISGQTEINENDSESQAEPKSFQGNLNVSAVTNKKLSRKNIFLFFTFGFVVVSIAALAYLYVIRGNLIEGISHSKKELSIIVLPFKDLSGDQNNQWLADGFAEDIINHLCNITSLGVVSRTTSQQFRESTLSAPEIGKKMNVNYILEGSVRLSGDKIRITVQLIDASRDIHLWSQNFDRELNDIIGIQGEIAIGVAYKLNAVLSDDEIRQIKKIPTQNPEAYTYYLQARFLLHKANDPQRSDFDKESVMNCIQYYEKAIAEDENFAEAYAGLANAWFNISAWGWLPGGFSKARELSMKALEIDQECAEAHAVLGAFLVWGQRNFEEGGRELETSVRLNPNFATARQWYAQYFMITGPIEDARIQVNYALELEPFFWLVQNLNAWIYYFENKYDEAIDACLLARGLKPDYIENEWLFFLNYAKLGEGEKAAQMLQTITKHYPGAEQYDVDIMEAYNKLGINGLFIWLIDVNINKPIPLQGLNAHPFYIAWWNAILGNKDESIYWLEKNMQEKQKLSHYFNLIATNPDFDILRDDPRFLIIVDKIGLTPYNTRKVK